MSNTSSENLENTCVVCFKNVSIYSVGDCDHPVCFECSTRMRVLCRQNECPICRQDMPKVIFTKDVQPFRNIKSTNYLMDKKFKICFDSAEIQAAYSRLLEHVCTKCPSRPAFRTFQNLKDHVRKEHEMYYCDLCVENLKIFTAERRCYTRQELGLHRRKGDPDDRSHRGHPLCEFCDQRYMDNDELFRHLRRDHLFCHFCDADGFHQYYSSYDYLRDHFRTEHYLCEEGGCIEEKFTSVFRTEIDLKAHRASVHGRSMGKAAAKQARMLELEFTLAPRPRDNNMRGGRRGPGRGRGRHDDEDLQGAVGGVGGEYEDGHCPSTTAMTTTVFRNAPHINTDCIEEFPTLGGEAPTQRGSSGKVAVNNSGVTIRTVRHSQHPLAITEENFPALGPEGSCNTVRLSVNSTTQERPNSAGMVAARGAAPKAPTNVSIHVNHRPSGSSQNIRIRPTSSFQDNFPSLSGAKVPPVSAVHWLGNPVSTGAKSKVQTQQAASHQPLKTPTPEDFPSLSSRFNAGCSVGTSNPVSSNSEGQSKKASSLMIPVTTSWMPSHSSSSLKTLNNPQSSNETVNDDPIFPSTGSLGNIKVKSKKKKSKTSAFSSTSSNDSPQSSKSGKDANAAEGGRKKKKQQQQTSSDSETSNKTVQSRESINENQENENSSKSGSKKRQGDNQERKRSELLIASLSSQETSHDNKMVKEEKEKQNKCTEEKQQPFSSDTFSDLPTVSDAGNLPPGFNKAGRTTVPPPGFGGGNCKAPPPGFSVTLNSVVRPQTNGLTFTNSSGQSYCILPSKTSKINYVYVPPQNFARRNQALVNRVKKTLVDPCAMEDFCQVSKMFRQGDISAGDFYSHCRETMGEKAFADIFPELLVLLPDIAKQQELWSAHTRKETTVHGFEVCALCQQVLSVSDLRQHVGSHTLENHFPALGVSENTQQAWGKK